MLLLRRVFQSAEVLAGTIRAVQAREAEEGLRLSAEKAAVENELAVVKASAGRGRGQPGGPKAFGPGIGASPQLAGTP